MTTEHTTTGTEASEGLCRAGSRTDNPCWRLATTSYNDYPCCDEHARLFEVGEEERGAELLRAAPYSSL